MENQTHFRFYFSVNFCLKEFAMIFGFCLKIIAILVS